MKKFLYLTSAAALALVSCSDEFTPNDSNNVVLEGKSRIVATYPMGNPDTRTSLENNGQATGYNYMWNTGDNISVVGSAENLYVKNAMYVYANTESAISGNFVGQVNLQNGKSYYGIYPYNPDLAPNPNKAGEYPVSINQYQNFNSKANKNWNNSKANGSFANGEAPAVAVATAANNELDFTFQPLASYLVFPMTGVGTVNTVSLEISVYAEDEDGNASSKEVALWGTTYVNPNDPQPINTADFDPANTKVTVDCGSGVTLNATEPVNFWFVVPTGIKLAGATVTLTVNDGTTRKQALSKTFSDSWVGSNGSNKTLVNDVRWIWMSKETAFQYNTTGAYMITKPWQFLEYAYAVSHDPEEVVAMYKELSGLNSTDYNYNYTDLENIVNDLDLSEGTYTKVNPAVIVGDVNITKEALQKYLSGVNLNGLAPYYQAIYVDYIKNQSIIPMGGYVGFTLSGQKDNNDVPGTLSGLTVVGNGMFPGTPNKALAQNVNDLVLNNVTVNATGYKDFVNFLASPNNSNFKNVTINSNCQLLADNGVEKGVFTTIANAYISVADVNNNATQNIPFFANQLNVIQAIVGGSYSFDFTKPGRGINAFNNIVMLDGSQTSIFLVNDENTATNLMTKVNKDNKINSPYSVLGNDTNGELTSFWTGHMTANNMKLNNKSVVTAEWLRYNAITPNPAVELKELIVNINLLNKRWYSKTVDLTVVGNGHYISNVYIDGTTDGTSSSVASNGYNYLTLFGNYSAITNLTVNNVNIVPSANATGNLVVAALSTGPQTNTRSYNITVNGLNVDVANAKAKFAEETMGGLYFRLTEEAFVPLTINNKKYPVLESLSVTKVGGYTNGYGCGYLAGSLQVDVTENNFPLTNPCSMEGHTGPLFGTVNINLQKQDGQTTVLTLNGFGTEFINETNINKFITTNAKDTYFLRLYQDSTTSTLWEYNGKEFEPATL